MLKQLLLSLMLLGFAGVSAASVFEVTLDPAPYSRKLAREQAVDVLLARLAGGAAEASWVRDEIRENGARYREDEQTGGGYRVRFERGELLPLLESAGLKAWTGPRPSLLVWQVNGQRALDTMTTGWRRAGSDFAVPILWPLWDLQEHLQVNKDALLQNGALTEASRRYGAELWLAVQQRSGQLDWRLFSRDGEPPGPGASR
ncbi:DUF2066 domain-containing protein [Oceanimonas sp. NS1]|nr:DUF2066 domain-containing protein [Oceanimonas sp. NS1]